MHNMEGIVAIPRKLFPDNTPTKMHFYGNPSVIERWIDKLNNKNVELNKIFKKLDSEETSEPDFNNNIIPEWYHDTIEICEGMFVKLNNTETITNTEKITPLEQPEDSLFPPSDEKSTSIRIISNLNISLGSVEKYLKELKLFCLPPDNDLPEIKLNDRCLIRLEVFRSQPPEKCNKS